MAGLKDIGIRKLLPKHINAGGLILGATYLHTNTDAQYYSINTSAAMIGTPTKISFKAPSNGKIKIRICLHLVHLDSGTAGASFSLGIYSNNSNSITGYLTDIDGCQWDGSVIVAQYDETDNSNIVAEAYFKGLTASTTYEWEIHGKSSASNSHRVYYGKDRGPFLVEAVTLPSTVIISSDSGTNFNNGL